MRNLPKNNWDGESPVVECEAVLQASKTFANLMFKDLTSVSFFIPFLKLSTQRSAKPLVAG